MICTMCGRDINQLGQDNMSPVPGYPVCEDCASTPYFHLWAEYAMAEQLTFREGYGFMTIQSCPEGFAYIHYNSECDELESGVIEVDNTLIVDAARIALEDVQFDILKCPVIDDKEFEQKVLLHSKESLVRFPPDPSSQIARREAWLGGNSRVDIEYMILDNIIEQAEETGIKGTYYRSGWSLLLRMNKDLITELMEDLYIASQFWLLGARVYGKAAVHSMVHVILFYMGDLPVSLIPNNLLCGELPVKIHPVCVTREDDLRAILENAEKELEEEANG